MRNIYLSVSSRFHLKSDDAVIVKKFIDGHLIYTMAIPNFKLGALLANYSYAYDATTCAWMDDKQHNDHIVSNDVRGDPNVL